MSRSCDSYIISLLSNYNCRPVAFQIKFKILLMDWKNANKMDTEYPEKETRDPLDRVVSHRIVIRKHSLGCSNL